MNPHATSQDLLENIKTSFMLRVFKYHVADVEVVGEGNVGDSRELGSTVFNSLVTD